MGFKESKYGEELILVVEGGIVRRRGDGRTTATVI